LKALSNPTIPAIAGSLRWRKPPRRAALELSASRTTYFGLLSELDQLRLAGVGTQWQQELQGRCWYARREACPLLAKLLDEGADVREAAAGFDWSPSQPDNPHPRQWLC
jgi:hypothetical protein